MIDFISFKLDKFDLKDTNLLFKLIIIDTNKSQLKKKNLLNKQIK